MDAIYWLQTVCTLLIFVEYGSQIWKIYKVKSVEGISLTYWVVKLTITALQLVILLASSNPLKVYLSQMLSLIFSAIVFAMTLHYAKKVIKK